jgi:KDO2-lipid IV(A) lauroyltransferase
MFIKNVLWIIQTAVFYIFTLLFAFVPDCLVKPIGQFTGKMGAILIRRRRHIAVENIRQAFPFIKKKSHWDKQVDTPEEIADIMFCHLGMSLVETCRLYHGRGQEIIDRIDVRGQEHLETARARGKGVVIVTGHCGNWELAALAMSRKFNSPMSVVARRQKNPWLNSMVEKMRLRYNNLIIYKDNAFRGMLSAIRKNGIVGILVDQAVRPDEGALINFLGRKAWASKAPVLLALKSGAAVLPAFIHREADRHIIDIYPEIEFSRDHLGDGIAAEVQKYSNAIENFVTNYPFDWYWVHRRWKRAGDPITE